MQEDKSFLCSVCFKSIDLKQCKADDRGRPVHEDCYTRMLLHQHFPSKNMVKKTPAWTGWLRP
jgi:hypothetical protein